MRVQRRGLKRLIQQPRRQRMLRAIEEQVPGPPTVETKPVGKEVTPEPEALSVLIEWWKTTAPRQRGKEFGAKLREFNKTATAKDREGWRKFLGIPKGLVDYTGRGAGRAAVMASIAEEFVGKAEAISDPEERAEFIEGAPKQLQEQYAETVAKREVAPPKPSLGPTLDIKFDLKPDRPGGQTHTLPNGQVVYILGSTMHKMGFRTPEEYRDAQRYGLAFGPHKGELVPEGSIIIHHRLIDTKTRKYKTIRLRYSNEAGMMAPTLRAHVKINNYWVEVETSRGTQLLHIKDVQAFIRLKGREQFRKAMELGLIPKGSEYVAPITKEDIARIEKHVKETQMVGGPPVEAPALEPRDWVYLTAKQVKEKAEFLETAETRAKERIALFRERNEALNRIPAKYHTQGGVDLVSYLADHQQDTRLLSDLGFSKTQIEQAESFLRDHARPGAGTMWLTKKDYEEFPHQLRVMYDKKGMGGISELQESAAGTLDNYLVFVPVIDPRGRLIDQKGYDLAKFLEEHPQDEWKLRVLLFKKEDIDKAKDLNKGLVLEGSEWKRVETEFRALSLRNQGSTILVALGGVAQMDYFDALIEAGLDPKIVSTCREKRDRLHALLRKGPPREGGSAKQRQEVREAYILKKQELSQEYMNYLDKHVSEDMSYKVGALLSRASYEVLPQAEKGRVLAYFNSLAPQRFGPFTISKGAVPEWEALKHAGYVALTMVPIVGTVMLWDEMSTPWKVVSVAGDVLVIGGLVGPRLLSSAVNVGRVPGMAKVMPILNQGVRQSRRALRLADKRLVKPFNVLIKEQRRYAEGFLNVRGLEKTLATTAGEVYPEVVRSLANARAALEAYKARLIAAARTFSEAQVKSASNITMFDDPWWAKYMRDSFASDIVRSTEDAVKVVTEARLLKVSTIKGKLSKIEKALITAKGNESHQLDKLKLAWDNWVAAGSPQKGALRNSLQSARTAVKGAGARVSEMQLELSRLRYHLSIAQSGDVVKATTEVAKARAVSDELEKTLLRAKVDARMFPHMERDWEAIIRLLQTRATNQMKVVERLEATLAKSIKSMEIEWAKPWTRGRGDVAVADPTKSRLLPPRLRTGGGGARVERTVPFISAVGVRGTRAIIAGQEAVVSEPIFAPGTEPWPETIRVLPHFRVAAPVVEPEVAPKPKVWPTRTPTPLPYSPGVERRVTPAVRPDVRHLVEILVAPFTETELEAEVRRAVKQLVKLGVTLELIPSILRSLGFKVSQEAEAKMQTELAAVMETKTGQAVETSTTTSSKPSIEPLISPAVSPSSAVANIAETATATRTTLEPTKPTKVIPATARLRGGAGKPEKEKVFTKEDGAIAWQQGALGRPPEDLWYAITAPYGKEDITTWLGAPPKGATIVKDSRSAYDTIQTITGKPPVHLKIPLGIMTVTITRPSKEPGQKGAIRFIRREDVIRASRRVTLQAPRSKTRASKARGNGNGLVSVRRGKIYHTNAYGGSLLSRNPIRGAKVKNSKRRR